MRYRATRVAAGLVGLGLVGGLFAIAGHNPAGWARDRWYALRGTLTPVDAVAATVPSKATLIADYPPADAVDGPLNTAWATTWGGGTAKVACGAPIPKGGRAPLVLSLPERTTIRGVEVASGLPAEDAQRVLQWRPVLLRLTFDDGSCQQIPLSDTPGLQRHRLQAAAATAVRVDIAAAAEPRSERGTQVALAEVRLLSRPG